jgi:hypothetical protein
MPTGLQNSPPFFSPKQTAPAGKFPLPAINEQFAVVIASTGVPQPCPARRVPPGAQVTVRGKVGNAAPVMTGLYREAVAGSAGYAVTADTEVFYPVDNLGLIWINGTAGDSALVAIRASAQA